MAETILHALNQRSTTNSSSPLDPPPPTLLPTLLPPLLFVCQGWQWQSDQCLPPCVRTGRWCCGRVEGGRREEGGGEWKERGGGRGVEGQGYWSELTLHPSSFLHRERAWILHNLLGLPFSRLANNDRATLSFPPSRLAIIISSPSLPLRSALFLWSTCTFQECQQTAYDGLYISLVTLI